ncbi:MULTISPECIES: succinate dehydrogenase iron-sulfur subunit [Deinococcus]|jgi:succinate dehydrogenase / fumarate reductase iron-sulfur subunit|uniref:succinate dehydrogenase n=2 Tax=Deinococcus TaxID=1298 RepID=A0A221SWU7_9DEIO|nr:MULTISPECIES: succinate dehydrogenase iron-sulfur subunit [Deinococcus]ASN81091.1 succinate dehydrogenase iron-sulfur subunit [Deinococcus ficus]MDP9763134.1 succinate dehydrogenase / fumarate reductase iron-sulfur subunit [Deinococcus enclensis]GHF68424.1 succinate dehydrogenase iron-sulfur subunit [Deinococcus ficus]
MTQTQVEPTTPTPELTQAPAGGVQLVKLNVKILRFNPEVDKKAHWETYAVQAQPTDRIVDVLNEIKWYQDTGLTFRRSCQHGICGSDAMLINGRNRLACKTLVRDVAKAGGTITVEPIRGLKVERDLLVDMEPFFDSYKAIMPYFINESPAPAAERYQSEADAELMAHSSNCILCACCTTSCPIFWVNGSYLGPAAIVQAHRFIFDSRDEATQQRLNIMNQNTGVWRCRTAYNCTEACPREIPITDLIEQVKRAVMFQQA